MEFNPNFTYMLQSAAAEVNVHHKNMVQLFKEGTHWRAWVLLRY
jgi:hypothetical protein